MFHFPARLWAACEKPLLSRVYPSIICKNMEQAKLAFKTQELANCTYGEYSKASLLSTFFTNCCGHSGKPRLLSVWQNLGIWLLKRKEVKQRVQEVTGGCLCRVPVSPWICMHATAHQESFLREQAFTFPALKPCWKITHTFSMKSLTITGKQTQRQLVGPVTPRRFNLSASHWENCWRKVKILVVLVFKRKGKM